MGCAELGERSPGLLLLLGEAGGTQRGAVTWPPLGLANYQPARITFSAPRLFRLSTSSGTKSLFLFYECSTKCSQDGLGGKQYWGCNQPQILFLLCCLSKSCFLLQALNYMVFG